MHAYIMFNVALTISYLITKILTLPLSLQSEKLRFARRFFVFTSIVFLSMPLVINALHINHFMLEPILRESSTPLFVNQAIILQTHLMEQPARIPMLLIVTVFFIGTGFSINLIKYIKNIHGLKKISTSAFGQRNINNIHVLTIATIEVPFCWSLLNKHFVVLPSTILNNRQDFRFALQHELQHIRQHDTQWSHLLIIINLFCFWNPFIKAWIKYFAEIQEFACDEVLIKNRKNSAVDYAQCLLNLAKNTLNVPQTALGMINSTFERRITMLFNTQKRYGKLLLTSTMLTCLLTTASTAYALSPPSNELTASQLSALMNYTNKGNALEITVTPEVMAEINNIRNSAQARTYMQDALSNMKHYQPIIEPALKNNDMPLDLMALPIVESGYQPLDASKNPMQAAGIWQIIPSTAQKYGLIIDSQRDDRMDTSLSTKAALNYLNNSHAKFNDWRLAVVAYEIGEQQTAALIEKTGSRDPWVLARSPAAPEELKNYLAMLGASVIIMHSPSLVSS